MAGLVSADQADHLAGRDISRYEAAQDLKLAIARPKTPNFNERHGRSLPNTFFDDGSRYSLPSDARRR